MVFIELVPSRWVVVPTARRGAVRITSSDNHEVFAVPNGDEPPCDPVLGARSRVSEEAVGDGVMSMIGSAGWSLVPVSSGAAGCHGR